MKPRTILKEFMCLVRKIFRTHLCLPSGATPTFLQCVRIRACFALWMIRRELFGLERQDFQIHLPSSESRLRQTCSESLSQYVPQPSLKPAKASKEKRKKGGSKRSNVGVAGIRLSGRHNR